MSALNPTKYLGNEAEYLQRVLGAESWSSTSGSWVGALESEFARYIGSRFAVAMNSGTATLHASLLAVGARPNDEIISPALSVVMNTTATLHAGCVPVYADVNPHTFNISPESVEQLISERTRAVMAVSLYGLPADLPKLREICDKHGVALIEDNAQCIGGRISGVGVGAFGDIASWSFENTKHLSAGEGGMVTTSDATLAEAMRKIGGHGFRNLTAEEGRVRLRDDVFQDPHYKRHDELGWNYRMPEFIAAVALAQLERVDQLVAMRVEAARLITNELSEAEFIRVQDTPDGFENTYYTLGATFDEVGAGVSWQTFRRLVKEAGGDGFYGAWAVPYLEPIIESGRYLHYMPDDFRSRSYPVGTCPTAEALQPTLMQFKTNYRSEASLERQLQSVRQAIRTVQTTAKT